MPETFPTIQFNKDGVCSFCLDYQPLTLEDRTKELERILSQYRGSNETADCIVTYSGGRDSSYTLLKIVKEFKMKPLAVTYDWGLMTPEAHRNWERTTRILGIEHVVIKPNTTTIKKHIRQNILAWLKKPHLGMVWLFTQGDKQAEYHIKKVARQRGVPLIVDGVGNMLEQTMFKHAILGVGDRNVTINISRRSQIELALRYLTEIVKNPGYINGSIWQMLKSFVTWYLLGYANQKNWLHFFEYVPWNESDVVPTIKTELDWESPKDTTSTWRTDDATAPFYNYLYFQIAGFTENDSYLSNLVREGVITRHEALRRAEAENQPRYGAIKDYLELIGLDYDEVMKRIDEIPRLF